MKKIFLVVFSVLTMVSLAACGGETPADTSGDGIGDSAMTEIIDVIEGGYKAVYDITDSTAIGAMTEMLNDINAAIGVKPASANSGNPESEFEIEFALKSGRSVSEAVNKEVLGYGNGERSAYIIRVVGKKIVISASDTDALKLAAKRFSSLAENGKLILTVDFDEVVVYDTNTYLRDGEIKELDAEAIGSNADLTVITVNGKEVVGFETSETEYNVGVADLSAVDVKAVAAEAGAVVTMSSSGTKTAVSVKSINGKNERVYTVNAFEKIESEVVNKGGADATVTFVIDDGDQSTATFVLEKMAPKYPSLKASFALITNKLATLDIITNPDGTKEYAKDENGFYTYQKNESVWAFWENAVKNKNFELVSHTHTHKYWGEDDNGGKFDYYNTAGEKFTSEDFPKGSVSKEFVASKQIIQDLDPTQLAAAFVRSGLTAGGKNVDYSATFWDPIATSGAYIGARGTYTYPDKPRDMVNVFSEFTDSAVRNKIKSYMVQHYNTNPNMKTTQANSGPAECLAAGIPYWTDYIDTAVEMKGWAAFCIHTIRPDTHDTRSGHYIYRSQADELFAHTQKLAADNKVWVATLSEGMIYAIERSTASVDAYVDGDKVVVILDHKEEGEYFNMPLTVKVSLPAGKTSASVDGNALKTFAENGKTYAYVDVAPKASVAVDVK